MKPHGKVSRRGLDLPPAIMADEALLLVSTVYARLTSREIEATRRSIRRAISKAGRLSVLAYPHLPLTKKPLQVRMGKGKGSKVSDWVCPVRPGQVLFRLAVRNTAHFLPLFARGARKLSIPVRVISAGLLTSH
jgi:large subunit ribosomal protein L16